MCCSLILSGGYGILNKARLFYMSNPSDVHHFDHLITLCREYQELIDQIESGGLETEEIRYLNGQRSVLHDQIMAEMKRVGVSFRDREHARNKAIQIARWSPKE